MQQHIADYLAIFKVVSDQPTLRSMRVAIYYAAQEEWHARKRLNPNQAGTLAEAQDSLYAKLAAVNQQQNLRLRPETLCVEAYDKLTDLRHMPEGLTAGELIQARRDEYDRRHAQS